MTPEYEEMIDETASKLNAREAMSGRTPRESEVLAVIDTALAALSSNTIKCENHPQREIAQACVRTFWEREPNVWGEGGIIEQLEVLEGRRFADITESVRDDFSFSEGENVEPVRILKDDSLGAVHEVFVRVSVSMCFTAGGRWYGVFYVEGIEI